jgi:hypothetical protein
VQIAPQLDQAFALLGAQHSTTAPESS